MTTTYEAAARRLPGELSPASAAVVQAMSSSNMAKAKNAESALAVVFAREKRKAAAPSMEAAMEEAAAPAALPTEGGISPEPADLSATSSQPRSRTGSESSLATDESKEDATAMASLASPEDTNEDEDDSVCDPASTATTETELSSASVGGERGAMEVDDDDAATMSTESAKTTEEDGSEAYAADDDDVSAVPSAPPRKVSDTASDPPCAADGAEDDASAAAAHREAVETEASSGTESDVSMAEAAKAAVTASEPSVADAAEVAVNTVAEPSAPTAGKVATALAACKVAAATAAEVQKKHSVAPTTSTAAAEATEAIVLDGDDCGCGDGDKVATATTNEASIAATESAASSTLLPGPFPWDHDIRPGTADSFNSRDSLSSVGSDGSLEMALPSVMPQKAVDALSTGSRKFRLKAAGGGAKRKKSKITLAMDAAARALGVAHRANALHAVKQVVPPRALAPPFDPMQAVVAVAAAERPKGAQHLQQQQAHNQHERQAQSLAQPQHPPQLDAQPHGVSPSAIESRRKEQNKATRAAEAAWGQRRLLERRIVAAQMQQQQLKKHQLKKHQKELLKQAGQVKATELQRRLDALAQKQVEQIAAARAIGDDSRRHFQMAQEMATSGAAIVRDAQAAIERGAREVASAAAARAGSVLRAYPTSERAREMAKVADDAGAAFVDEAAARARATAAAEVATRLELLRIEIAKQLALSQAVIEEARAAKLREVAAQQAKAKAAVEEARAAKRRKVELAAAIAAANNKNNNPTKASSAETAASQLAAAPPADGLPKPLFKGEKPMEVFNGPAPDIGPDWTLKRLKRMGGATKGTEDRYWFSPQLKKKFRSKTEIKKFKDALERLGANGDEETAWKVFKKKLVLQDDGRGGVVAVPASATAAGASRGTAGASAGSTTAATAAAQPVASAQVITGSAVGAVQPQPQPQLQLQPPPQSQLWQPQYQLHQQQHPQSQPHQLQPQAQMQTQQQFQPQPQLQQQPHLRLQQPDFQPHLHQQPVQLPIPQQFPLQQQPPQQPPPHQTLQQQPQQGEVDVAPNQGTFRSPHQAVEAQ